VQDDGQNPFCVFLGYGINDKAPNPFAPSAIKLHFAIASARKASTIVASKSADLNAIVGASRNEPYMDWEQVKQTWQQSISNNIKDRGVRYIVTGNLIQAFGINDFRGGKLVQFTTNDGKMRKGLYLENYNPNGNGVDTQKLVPTMPIFKARKAIKAISNNGVSVLFDGFGKSYITKLGNNDYRLYIESSKKVGGDIYLDNNILKLVEGNNFNLISGAMRADVTPENLDAVLLILQNKHNVSVRLQPWQMELVQDENRRKQIY